MHGVSAPPKTTDTAMPVAALRANIRARAVRVRARKRGRAPAGCRSDTSCIPTESGAAPSTACAQRTCASQRVIASRGRRCARSGVPCPEPQSIQRLSGKRGSRRVAIDLPPGAVTSVVEPTFRRPDTGSPFGSDLYRIWSDPDRDIRRSR